MEIVWWEAGMRNDPSVTGGVEVVGGRAGRGAAGGMHDLRCVPWYISFCGHHCTNLYDVFVAVSTSEFGATLLCLARHLKH